MNELSKAIQKRRRVSTSLRTIKAKIILELALHQLSDRMHKDGYFLLFCGDGWADDEANFPESAKHGEQTL